ncbi:MAG: hypothetical protein FWH29_09750 [Methanobrevibacter sp.]|nr:hypothetical protein [Methanobrevibacter sp.]
MAIDEFFKDPKKEIIVNQLMERKLVDINIKIKKVHSEKMNNISQEFHDKYNTSISKAAIIRMALDNFFEDIDMDEILSKHKLL